MWTFRFGCRWKGHQLKRPPTAEQVITLRTRKVCRLAAQGMQPSARYHGARRSYAPARPTVKEKARHEATTG
jgi:hypothetical protein